MKLRLIAMTSAVATACLMLTTPTPALAGASADFSGCDGLKKPKRKNDGMRGEATVSGYGGFRSPFGSTARGPSASSILASCNRALAHKTLRPEQTLRRAHLLRARAVAQLQLGELDAALTDLDAAEAELTEYHGEFFFDRSMGASLDLIRAIVLSDKGNGSEAVSLAEAASDKRPYAVQIQQAATLIRDANAADDADRKQIWSKLALIDPNSRNLAARQGSRGGSFEEQVAAAGDELDDLPPMPDLAALLGRNAGREITRWAHAYEDRMALGYAQAALGMNDAARERIAEVRMGLGLEQTEESETATASDEAAVEAETQTIKAETGIETETEATESDAETQIETETEKEKRPTDGVNNRLVALIAGGKIKTLQTLTEARIAVSEDRLDDVVTALEVMKLRSTQTTLDLYAAYDAALAARGETEPKLAELLPEAESKASKLAGYAGNLRLRPESKRKVIDYKKSRPNVLGAIVGGALSLGTSLLGGIDRTMGFRSTPNDDGTVTVEYNGNTTSGPVVQEMTLLRAAELTQEAGKSHFFIDDRKDYQRYLTRTQYSIEISRSLTGYKTELVIRYLDDGSSEPNALDAIKVIDDLGPIYYSDKQANK